MTVLAATAWKSNAELIADVARLGYLRKEWVTLDPTYGRGVWWKLWRPNVLVTNDQFVPGAMFNRDFCSLPFNDDEFDAVAFDPPYVSVGGRETSGIKKMHEGFGLTDAPTSPRGVQDLINAGLIEMHRVVKRGGIVLVKCQDYISSGKFWPGVYFTQWEADRIGFEMADRFLHLSTTSRPQPAHKRQMHARNNVSTLLVLRKR